MNLFWKKIKDKLFGRKNSPGNKEYLIKLVKNLERLKTENKSIPFTIIGVREKGFIVKVGGLYAYLSFNYMPWKYSTFEPWKVVSKYLIGIRFYCKIYRIDKDPLFILINAKNHIFRNIKLTENSKYTGVVIRKAKYGLFVDIGYHFGWKYGSFVGLIHKSKFQKMNMTKRMWAMN